MRAGIRSGRLATFVAAGLAVTAYAAEQQPAFRAGVWTGWVAPDEGGTHVCLAVNGPTTQVPRAFLMRSSAGDTSLALYAQSWNGFEEDSESEVTLVLDGKPVALYSGQVTAPQMVALTLAEEDLALLPPDQVTVEFRTAQGSAALQLDNVSAALAALKDCAESKPHAAASSPVNALPMTVLTCELSSTNVQHTLTVSFNDKTSTLMTGGTVRKAQFSETEIYWHEPTPSGGYRSYEIERFSGAITMYVSLKGESSGRRMATGHCEVAKTRKF